MRLKKKKKKKQNFSNGLFHRVRIFWLMYCVNATSQSLSLPDDNGSSACVLFSYVQYVFPVTSWVCVSQYGKWCPPTQTPYKVGHSQDADTWLHVLLKCNQHHIHALRTKRHNKAVWELRKLILSTQKSRCYTLMNAGTFNNNPQENTVPTWLLPCTCAQQRCHCNARFKPDLLCIKELPHQGTPPLHPTDNITIQFIEFTYTNDRFPQETINNKTQKYQPLINNIAQQRWKIDPLIVITAGARGTTHSPSMKQLEQTFNLPINSVKHAFKEINTIAIQHATSILLHKRRIENNQAIPTEWKNEDPSLEKIKCNKKLIRRDNPGWLVQISCPFTTSSTKSCIYIKRSNGLNGNWTRTV